MSCELGRRELLQVACGGAVCMGLAGGLIAADAPAGLRLISPGCRRSKVRVGKLYLVGTNNMWPTPKLDIEAERQRYENEFARMKKEFADVEFVGNGIVKTAEDIGKLADSLKNADGILVIHLTMGALPTLHEILKLGRPTMVFAAPYSGHEWTAFGGLRRQKEGALLDCLLTADMNELAAAVRPFRAIHHLREAKVLNVTARTEWLEFANKVKEKFGTQIKQIDRDRMIRAYEAVPEPEAQAEAQRWMSAAQKVVEPSKDEIVRSCRLALAFEKLLNEEEATVITVDCYGTMYHQLPAFPCIGNVRLNDLGLGGICESDLEAAMTHILFQGLSGRPSFISDPTMDVSTNAIILAHCLGSTKMDGPEGPAAPYRLRTIMERQEGAVPQVFMRVGQRVTQGRLVGTDMFIYFTGQVIEAPDLDRGCRTKITVKVDGDAERLWQDWAHGLHRSTCYGDWAKDLQRFAKFAGIRLVNEVEKPAQA